MGGLARRAATFDEVRKQKKNVLLLDAGNLFGNRNETEKKQTEFLARETAALGYEVFGVGERDLNFGLEFLRDIEKQYGFVFTNANLRSGESNELVFPPYLVREQAGLKIGIISVLSPSFRVVSMTAQSDNYTADSPRDALEKYLPELKGKADLIVLLAQIGTQELRQLLLDLGEGSGIDVCVEGHAPRQYRRVNKVGDILLVAANNEGKYAGQLDMLITADGQVQDATVTIHGFDDKAPEIEEIRKRVDKFEAENKPTTTQTSAFDHNRPYGSDGEKYLGVSTCARCHSTEARSYSQTKHAQAFQTLVAKGQQNNSDCVSCHVVGFEFVNGYDRVPHAETPGRDALRNVQCEACHGYGTQHDRQGDWMTVAKESCATCHDSANSPDFEYASYWAKIAH
jgi:Cytochrome c554 and c-prime